MIMLWNYWMTKMNKYAAMFSDYVEHGIMANSEDEAAWIFIDHLIEKLKAEGIDLIITWEEF